MSNKKWFTWVLLLLSVSLAAAAEDVAMRGCRRGTPRQHPSLTRTTQQTRQPGGDFYQGERHQLVVLAAFNDRSFKGDEAATLSLWNNIFNTPGYQDKKFQGSVHDYFYDQSYGKFDLTFDLHYVQLADNCKKYRSTQKDDENSQYLVQDVMDQLEKLDIDWSLYDWNGDGYVNQLIILFAGMSMHDGGDDNSIWSHQWWLSDHMKDRTSEYCEPRTITNSHDGHTYTVDCYCALAELSGRDDYGSFGTICHEYTHCFGFPDFYGNIATPRQWDLMDYGNNNGDGFRPCGYSAHERWLMGWLSPEELSDAATINQMSALAEQPQAYLVRNDAYAKEYYIIENRQQRGWDASLPSSGIVIFHINYDEDTWTGKNGEIPNTSKDENSYYIFPANNKFSYYNGLDWPYPQSTNDALTNESAPASILHHKNTDGTLLMSKPITEMAVTNGLASFKFMGGSTAIRETQHQDQPTILYQYGPLRILRMPNGEIRKVLIRN